jgi:hypothetical protein
MLCEGKRHEICILLIAVMNRVKWIGFVLTACLVIFMDWKQRIEMCKKIPVVLLLLLLVAVHGHAQFSEKANFFGGMTMQFVGLTDVTSPSPTYSFYAYGLGAGMDYVLAHSNDVVSLGVNPNAHLCFQLNSYTGFSFLGSAPVYMLARIGAGATPFNEQKVGIGAGIGGTASYFATTGNGFSSSVRTFFVNPGAIAELCLRTRGSNYLFRFNWSLMSPTQEVTIDGSITHPFRVGLLGLSVFYTF